MHSDHRSLASNHTLVQRALLLRKVRAYFDEQGFVEVQPPVIGSEFVIDRHIDPIELQMQNPATREEQAWYLQSSPEAAMKRLLVGGLERIYSLGPVFRLDEFGTRHNPEFTMLEWYNTADRLDAACAFVDGLVQAILGRPPASRIRFSEAFAMVTSHDLFAATVKDFQAIAERFSLGVTADFSDDWDDWVNLIFSELIQPRMGIGTPAIVTHFPASQAALARLDEEDPRVAERFEYFVDGIELANGYCELLDADELLRRCEEENRLRLKDGKTELPIPLKLISAMREGLPAMSGCALGFDRLAMIATGAVRLSDVLVFPIDRA